MTSTFSETALNVDLADGGFYASGEAGTAYAWMRANQPVFRDRNGLAAAATYQAVIDAERDPDLFSSAGGIRPDQPGMLMMIDMDDPAHVLRRKLVNAGFTRKRVRDKEASIGRPANFVSGLESMPVVFTPTAPILGCRRPSPSCPDAERELAARFWARSRSQFTFGVPMPRPLG